MAAATAKPNRVTRRRFSTARDVCCRPEAPLWENTSKRQRCKIWVEPWARGSAWAKEESQAKDNVTRDGFSPGHEVRRGPNRRAGGAPERGQERRHEEKRNPHLHTVRNQAEPAWNQAAGSLLLAIVSLVWGGSRARVGTRRNQAGTRLKSANLPYQEPFSPDPSHLLNIILFKRWGDQRKAACRPAEVSPSRILKGGLSRPRAEAVLYKRAGFFVKEAHSAPGRSESVQSVLQWPACME